MTMAMAKTIGHELGCMECKIIIQVWGIKALIPQLQYKIYISAIQETIWHGKAVKDMKTHTVFYSSKEDTHERGHTVT